MLSGLTVSSYLHMYWTCRFISPIGGKLANSLAIMTDAAHMCQILLVFLSVCCSLDGQPTSDTDNVIWLLQSW